MERYIEEFTEVKAKNLPGGGIAKVEEGVLAGEKS